MEKCKLGVNGLEIGEIGYGVMFFFDMYGFMNEIESYVIFNVCCDLGVIYLDMVNIYGMGKLENVFGFYLKMNLGVWDEFVIVIKVSIICDVDGNCCFDNLVEYFEVELDKFLQRFGVECVDLFYVYCCDLCFMLEEMVVNLGRLVEKGKICVIGFLEIVFLSLWCVMIVFLVVVV